MATKGRLGKTTRLETRVTREQKALIERAAAYSERSVSEFVITHLQDAAQRVIDQHERLQLDQEQSQILVKALLSSRRPNKKLLRAMDNYRQRVASR